MYSVYFDSGTTNTRAYLFKSSEIIDLKVGAIGSKDSSIAGDNLVLLRGLKQMFDELLDKNSVNEQQVDSVFASGMVTSPFGIKEIAHVSTPVSAQKLFESTYTHFESVCFKREIKLIRGVKSISEDYQLDPFSVSAVNNMRGEEIEIFGILPKLSSQTQNKDIAVFLPGSHTHIGYIKNKEIADILSTFSGEIFHAITNYTILSGSVKIESTEIDPEMLFLGFDNLQKFGFNRALYICHAMKIFDVTDNIKRRSYFEGIIIGDIVHEFLRLIDQKWTGVKSIVLAGNLNITKSYKMLLEKMLPDFSIEIICPEEKYSFAARGYLSVFGLM